MIYIIGGPPRMGKSTLAQRLLEEKGWPCLSTDLLTRMLESSGQTSFYSQQKADQFLPFFDRLLTSLEQLYENYVVEGDAFYPSHLQALSEKGHKFRALFLINTKITTDDLLTDVGRNNWLHSTEEEALQALPGRIKEASTRIQKECNELDIACYDLSSSRNAKLDEALACLSA